jgi:putative ABC transport system permease protein
MRFLALVPINLYRHKLRALIGVAGIAFGVAAMLTILALVNGAIGMFERILSSDSHYLVFERNVSDLFFSSVKDGDVDGIARMPGVESADAMLFGIVSSPGFPVITCFGLRADDPRLGKARWLAGARENFGRSEDEIFLGSRAAEFLKATVGDEVPIGPRRFRVGGVLKTENGFEDGGVFLPLKAAQAYFHREGVCSLVAVKLRDRGAGAEFKRAVEAAHPGLIALENREFSASYNSFRILKTTAWAVGLCAFLLGGLGVANTMLMSVFSRIREIAVLRVCGFSELQVSAMIFAEAAAVAVAGLALGLLLGWLALVLLPHVPQFQGYLQAQVRPGVLVGIAVTALVTAVAGAIYPARFAARIQAAEALRYE